QIEDQRIGGDGLGLLQRPGIGARHVEHAAARAMLHGWILRFRLPNLAKAVPRTSAMAMDQREIVREQSFCRYRPQVVHFSSMTIDTLEYVKKLEAAGVDRKAAEAHAEALRPAIGDELATKSDILRLETRLEGKFTELEGKIFGLEGKFADFESEM